MSEKLRLSIIFTSFIVLFVLVWTFFSSTEPPVVEQVEPLGSLKYEDVEPTFEFMDPIPQKTTDHLDEIIDSKEVLPEDISADAKSATKNPKMEKGSGQIAGLVQMFDDTPHLFDTVVTLTSVPDGSSENEALPIKTARCDKDGKFWFSNIPPIKAVISLQSNKFVRQDIVFPSNQPN